MRRCQEVLARVGMHRASLTATVSRIADLLPVQQAHINQRVLVPDTSVSTDLTIHPSLRTACDTALHHLPKAYAQALHSRISTLEQCDPDPSIQNEDPAHIPALLTPDSPLDARYSSILTPSFPPPPQVHKPFKPRRLRRPLPSLPSVSAIRVVSFNTAKSQNTPASILHFLNEGYDIILLQELNSLPLLPQRYAFGNDRTKGFSNVCDHKHGVSVIAGPRIARYTSCVRPRDSDGLSCGAKIYLPEATPLHVFSVYSPPVRTGAPAPYRDTIQRVLDSYFNDHSNHILGGDFNCVLDPELDQHSLVDLHEWHWLTGEVKYLPSRLVDTFRSEHPSLRQYTLYATDHWDSEARLDYIFASPRLVSNFALLGASVVTDSTISDHHPVVAVFQCPSPILLSQPALPPCIFWKLSSDEKQQFSKSVQLISDWCRDLQDAPARAPLEEIIAATDSLLMQVGSAYHKITRPKPQRKDQEGYGKLRKLLRTPPPPSPLAFPKHIAEVQSVVNTLRSSDETKAKKKLHSSLVRGVQMKSTVALTLCPKDLEPLVVRDPATKELLSDPADAAEVLRDTLLHLGGHPDYAPPQDFVDEVLSHSPTCPVSTKNDHIPPVTWQEFLNHLKHSKPSKAGGPDKTNNYILALCPDPFQRFFHSILNRFLHAPLPPHWLCAKICLLYKKGDPFFPSNYRPIALLNCIYKLLATSACKHLRAQAFAHDILSENQHGGLPGHQCADHLYHIKALYAKSKKSYSLFIRFQ